MRNVKLVYSQTLRSEAPSIIRKEKKTDLIAIKIFFGTTDIVHNTSSLN